MFNIIIMAYGVMGRRSYGLSELWAVGIKTRTLILDICFYEPGGGGTGVNTF